MACFIEIYQPDGQVYNPNGQKDGRWRLSEMTSSSGKTEIIIGRAEADNPNESTDISLPVDDKKISRKHCSIEIKDNCYFWVKSTSAHETLLRKANPNTSDQDIQIINKEAAGYQLRNGDQILILSQSPTQDNPYWTCFFYDDNETDRTNSIIYPHPTKYFYQLTSMKLYAETSNQQQQEIKLSGKPLQLIHYLANKVAETNSSYLAEYNCLISHIWENPFGIEPARLQNLAMQIKNSIIEAIGADAPKLIETVNKCGYRLNNCRVI